MVTIIYYENPIESDGVISEHSSVSEWIRQNFTEKSDILDLRFFKGDMLGDEIFT